MRAKAVPFLAACLLCLVLAGCGVDTGTTGLLDGLARQEASEPACLSCELDIVGTGHEAGKYVEARGSFRVERWKGVLSMRDVELRLERDGALFDRQMEIWTEDGTSYAYIGQPYSGGTWYEYPAGQTRAAGIDPSTVGGLLLAMAERGLACPDAVARDESEPGVVRLDVPLGPGDVASVLNGSDRDMAEEPVEWTSGTASLRFGSSDGRLISCAVSAEGASENFDFTYALDLDVIGQVGEFSIPEDVMEAARRNYTVGPEPALAESGGERQGD